MQPDFSLILIPFKLQNLFALILYNLKNMLDRVGFYWIVRLLLLYI